MSRTRMLVLAVVVLVAAVPAPAGASSIDLKAVLNGANEVPPVNTPGTGLATLVFNEQTSQMTFRLDYADLAGTTTLAHIHRGAAGVNGPPVYTLASQPFPSGLQGTVQVNPGDFPDLFNQRMYVNIHTTAFPNGEVRGQVVPARPSFNMSLVSHLPLSTATDVAAQGNLVFVGRSATGVSIVDATNPAAPAVLSTWKHPTNNQVTNAARPLGSHLYVSSETGGPGLYGLDISNPAVPALVSVMGPPAFPANVHNLWADGSHLYLSAYGQGGGNVVVDVTNPASPQNVAVIPTGIHDNTVVGNTLHIAGGFDGMYLYDITNPASPVELSHFTAETADTAYYAHIAWPIDDRYVFLAEEIQIPPGGFGRGSYRVVDFADPGNPVAVFRWYSENAKDNPNITTHNVYVAGSFAYLSHYQDGVRVMDVSDPLEPVEVGWYDTYPEPALTLFEGCWGVDPFQGNDRIFASDRTHGLYVLGFNGARKATLEGVVRNAVTLAPIPGAGVKSLTANRSTFAGGNGAYTLKTGSGAHEVRATAAGFHPATGTVALTDLGTTVHDFLLVPSNIAVEEPAGPPAAGAPRLAVRASPNPTRGLAALRLTVPPDAAGEPLELAVYAVGGARIRTLARGRAAAGSQVVGWDGRDEAGRPAGAGVYFAELRVGSRVASEKIVRTR